MKRSQDMVTTPAARATARHLAALVKQARLARRWSQAELAERARVSGATVHRIEHGSVAASLGAWLAVLERLGLLGRLNEIRDPASETVLDETRAQRAGRERVDDLDF